MSFQWYWWQATDKWRHAYRGRRNDRITSDRTICGITVDLTTAPLTEFYPSCMDCWRLIKHLRGDTGEGWLNSTLRCPRATPPGTNPKPARE